MSRAPFSRRTIVAILALVLGSAAPKAQEPVSKKVAARLVKHYLRPPAPAAADRRAELLARLRTVSTSHLVAPLRRVLATADPDTCRAALVLARQLRVPALLPQAATRFGSDLGDLILEYGIAVCDQRALAIAWSRYREANGPRWQVVHNAFLDFGLPPSLFQRAAVALPAATAARSATLLDVLRRSTQRPKLTRERFQADWQQFAKAGRIERREFPATGIDLLTTRTRRLDHEVAWIHPNVRIGPGGRASIPAAADWCDSAGIRMWVRPRAEARARVHLRTAQGSWEVVFDADEWSVMDRDGTRHGLEGSSGTWTRLTFEFRSAPADDDPNSGSHRCIIRVGDRRLLELGELTRDLLSLDLQAGHAACTFAQVERIG